jgi:iron complex outermembrane receptor protein
LGTLFSVVGNVSVSQNKIKQFTEYRDNWDTYQQEIVTYRNRDLAFSPKVTSRVEVSCLLWKNRGISTKVEHQKQQVSATIAGKYVGKQFLDNTSNALAVLPSYFVSDIRVNVGGTRVLGNPISLIVSVNNWLNARYVSNGWVYRYVSAGHDARPNDPYTRLEGGAVYHQAGFFPQAGIHWMASFRMDF